MTILAEIKLPEETRYNGALALLYHDVLEDTDAALPEGLPERVVHLVQAMTFPQGSEQEMREIWSKEPEVRLLKLYDRTFNLMDSSWMVPDQLERHRLYGRKLADDVEANYCPLNIVKFVRTLLN
ncbi:hypothetical protein HY501_03335 [Candidatus Woesearchaeota archaeon]|nr:hypothetical protein [Candidatus Woesearchaeota archaeon]